jgi:hypothetical protein
MIRLSNLITEAGDKNFSNPVLNKVIKYKNDKGEDKEGVVGNLLRLAKDTPGRQAAEKVLPKDGTPERKSINKSLGSEKDGKSEPSAANTKKGGDTKEKPAAKPAPSAEKPQPAAMYKGDAAMAARLDTEKETQAKLAKDAEAKKDAHSSDGHGSGDDEAGLRKNIKTAVTKPKVYVRAIKDGIKDWAEDEKAFFKEKVHKGDTPERRSWGQALKDKAVGAYHALKKGFKHEVHTFKDAAMGIAMWKDGIDMTEPQKKAVKSVAKKFALGVVLGVVTGGLGAGAGAFAMKCMSGFIPHVVEETIIAGVGKAALFAGDTDIDEEKAMEQFLSVIADNIEKMDMPPEILAKAVEEYNAEKKEKGEGEITQNEAKLAVNQLQQLVKESIIR